MDNCNCDCKCKGLLHLLVGLIIIATAAYGGYYYATQQEVEPDSEPAQEESTEEPTEEPQEKLEGSTLVSLNDTWDLYTNYDLGFSIEVPKESTMQTDQAEYVLYPMQIIEDLGNNTVYLTNDPDATLESLQSADYTAWAIKVAEINSEDELIAFGAEKWGETCTKVELEETNYAGTYDSTLKGEEGENEYGFPNCFINGITYLKYSPEEGKAATWGVGQDNVMYLKNGDDFTAYDLDMGASFQFL